MNVATKDEAPPHVSRVVTEFSNRNFEGTWTRAGGPVAWSPDLNPLDFLVWACMKWRVYHGGNPKARHWLLGAIDEAAIGMSK
jgi:hypothetical protein